MSISESASHSVNVFPIEVVGREHEHRVVCLAERLAAGAGRDFRVPELLGRDVLNDCVPEIVHRLRRALDEPLPTQVRRFESEPVRIGDGPRVGRERFPLGVDRR